MNQRLMVYRKVAAARTERELESVLADVRDRYGALPPAVLNLAEYGRIRVQADHLGIDTIDREGRFVVIKFRPNANVDPVRLINVVREWPGAMLVPPVTLKLDLEASPLGAPPLPARARPGGGAAPAGRLLPPHPSRPWERGGGSQQLAGPRRRPSDGDSQTSSWWTARATTGDVKAGFTKEEILRKPEQDPRGETGVFGRLEQLLRALG